MYAFLAVYNTFLRPRNGPSSLKSGRAGAHSSKSAYSEAVTKMTRFPFAGVVYRCPPFFPAASCLRSIRFCRPKVFYGLSRSKRSSEQLLPKLQSFAARSSNSHSITELKINSFLDAYIPSSQCIIIRTFQGVYRTPSIQSLPE